MFDEHDEGYIVPSGIPEGLSLKTTYKDDESESKEFEGTVDSTMVQPVSCTVKIRVGYDVVQLFPHPIGMASMQEQFTRESMLYTVSSLNEFKVAVIDGFIVAEQKRMKCLNDFIFEQDLSDTGYEGIKIEYMSKGFKHWEIPFPESIRIKMKNWGDAQGYIRSGRPPIHIFLERGLKERVYIMTTKGSWHWGGFSDVSNINYGELYSNLLKTKQHCKNLDSLCGIISV